MISSKKLEAARATLRMAAQKFGAVANNRRHRDPRLVAAASGAIEDAARAFVREEHDVAALDAMNGAQLDGGVL